MNWLLFTAVAGAGVWLVLGYVAHDVHLSGRALPRRQNIALHVGEVLAAVCCGWALLQLAINAWLVNG